MTSRPVLLVAACLLAPACQTPAAPGDAKEAPPKTEAKAPEVEAKAPAADDLPGAPVKPLPEERHFKSLRQLTFGGENAEAYLSFDEKQLVFQSTRDGGECDQIYTMPLDPPTPAPKATLLSSGKGRTTCAYWLPDGQRLLYASTHAADDGCLPPPDRSRGYVWKLYPEFDIYTAKPDGSDVQPLVVGPGYDAEATISPRGDAIVFTSTRDGDPEIYTMNLDGSAPKRLTNAVGYDGGPFFSPDGTKIVYRANHPEGDEELAKYKAIQEESLVFPTRLELFVMDADGQNQRQITKNGKANFGPFFHPDGQRVIYSSNVHDERGRDFDLYMIGVDGEGEERITFNETFDGFPMFTRDGKRLVFASNRNNAAEGDTNVFLAEWTD
ncbi:MAG: hypothetical protein R3A51_20435 [Nannocystaceae bacterium]|nr:PD40 domain-containing protein [Myxococcales bacterium]